MKRTKTKWENILIASLVFRGLLNRLFTEDAKPCGSEMIYIQAV